MIRVGVGMNRRDALRAAAVGMTAGVAGCGFGGDGTGETTSRGDGTTSPADDGTSAGGSPLAMYDPRNTAATLERRGPDGSLTERERWSYTGPEGATDVVANYGPPVVADGRIVVHLVARYSQGDERSIVGELLALDGESWTVEWRQGTVRGGPVAPVVAEGTVLVPSLEGLVARSLADGGILWTQSEVTLPMTHPTVADRMVVQPGAHHLHALSLADGSHEWTAPIPGIREPPAIADGTVFVTRGDEAVALDFESGTEQWRQAHDGFESSIIWPGDPGPLGTPVVTDDLVVAAGSRQAFEHVDTGGLVAFDRTDGTQRWAFDVEGHLGTYVTPAREPEGYGVHGLFGPPAVADDTLYVASTDQDRAFVLAIDAATGDLVWQSRTAGLCYHTPVTADRVVAVSAGAVEVFERENGDRIGAATSPDWYLNPAPHQCLAGNAVIASGPGGIRRFQS